MIAEDIFKSTMALIDEMLDSGELDANSTAEYKAKAPHILTILQNEIIGIENRYKKLEDQVRPVEIRSLQQPLQIDSIKAETLLTYGLGAHLMIHENTTLASFFQQRYEELKGLFLKPTPLEQTQRIDKYDAMLNY